MSAGKERGAALTAWLWFVIIVNALFAFLYSVLGHVILPRMDLWRVQLLGALALLNVGLSLLLLAWIKWAFYGLCVVGVVIFVFNLLNGVSLLFAVFGLSGLLVLAVLLWRKWDLLI